MSRVHCRLVTSMCTSGVAWDLCLWRAWARVSTCVYGTTAPPQYFSPEGEGSSAHSDLCPHSALSLSVALGDSAQVQILVKSDTKSACAHGVRKQGSRSNVGALLAQTAPTPLSGGVRTRQHLSQELLAHCANTSPRSRWRTCFGLQKWMTGSIQCTFNILRRQLLHSHQIPAKRGSF